MRIEVDEHRTALVRDGLRTLPEAMAYLRLSRGAVYALMEQGHLPYVKLGRRRLVPVQAMLALAARGLVGG